MKVITIVDAKIDVESILCKIRKNIKDKKKYKDKLSFEDNFDNIFLSLIPKDTDFMDIEQQLDILRNSWDINPNKLLNGNRLVVFIKRIIRKLTRFLILPIVNEQNAFNYSVFSILKKNCEMKMEILHDRIALLEGEVKRLPVDCIQELLFKQGSFAINYLGKGFSDPEGNLIWTNQETAEIDIPIHIIKNDLKLAIKGYKLTPLQTVKILINNRVYGKIENYDSEFIIKADELLEQKYLNIRLIISKPYSPKELGIGDDTRKLGFALIAISLNVEMNKKALING